MALMREMRRRARQIAPQALLACLAIYFGYHAIQGDRGFLARQRLEREVEELRALRGDLEAQKVQLEKRVTLLRPDSLDPDMLEERARILLNYGYVDDYVIYDYE